MDIDGLEALQVVLRNYSHQHIDGEDTQKMANFGAFYNDVCQEMKGLKGLYSRITGVIWEEDEPKKDGTHG